MNEHTHTGEQFDGGLPVIGATETGDVGTRRHGPRHAAQRESPDSQRALVVGFVVVVVVALVAVGVVRVGAPYPIAHERVSISDPASRMWWSAPTIPWPTDGAAAVSVPGLGYTAQSGPETPVPVASLTKVMTAYIILKDHPLQPGQRGPDIAITAADAADYAVDNTSDQSSIQIVQGEELDESQLLEGMLVHSANDFAYTLATWDAGSIPNFVTTMNATAAKLGMRKTHFVDASGFTPGSVSTAASMLKVTTAAMGNPVFAYDVHQVSVTLPVSGTSFTYTPLLTGDTGGVPGVVGVKSGFTTQAGGCDILAYRAPVTSNVYVGQANGSTSLTSASAPTSAPPTTPAEKSSTGNKVRPHAHTHPLTSLAPTGIKTTRTVLVLVAVTSVQGPNVLNLAGEENVAIAQSLVGAMRDIRVVAPHTTMAAVNVLGTTVGAVTTTGVSLVMLPGDRPEFTLVPGTVRAGADPATAAGSIVITVGDERVRVPVITDGRLPAPGVLERLL